MKKFFAAILTIIVIALFGLYYVNNLWIEAFFNSGESYLIIGDEIIESIDKPIIEEGNVLLPFSIIKKHLDNAAFWDEKTNTAIFTTKDKLIKMKTDNLTAMVNREPINLNIPTKIIDESPYIPIEFLEEVLNIDLRLSENRVVIIDTKEEYIAIVRVINKGACVKKNPMVFSPNLKNSVEIGETLRTFGKVDKWYKVRTEDGTIGFIDEKYIKVEKIKGTKEEKEREDIESFKPEKGKINMVWEHVVSKNPDIKTLKKVEDLDVVSPTWFAVVDGEGKVANNADIDYVNWAHSCGYKVWGLVTNSFDPDITHEFLKDMDIRERIINQVLIYANLYELDGINIDFENIYIEDRDMLSQFIRELYPLCREQGLTLTMDVTMISGSANWSMSFDRKALSEAVDYMAIMGYDQHWASSPVAGSVAQYSWVEYGLKRILEEVPAEKIILGMPFYTRLWQEEKVDGKIKVTSKALAMGTVQKILDEKKPVLVWDKDSGQYYAEYAENDIIYKIWIEDAESINLKSSLVHKYNLAGAAAWRRGFETEDIWNVLAENLKYKEDYKAWAQGNQEIINMEN